MAILTRGSRGPKGNRGNRGPRGPRAISITRPAIAPPVNLLDNPSDIHQTPTSALGVGEVDLSGGVKPEPL